MTSTIVEDMVAILPTVRLLQLITVNIMKKPYVEPMKCSILFSRMAHFLLFSMIHSWVEEEEVVDHKVAVAIEVIMEEIEIAVIPLQA